MDAVGIAIIICVVVGLVIAAVVGVIAFMAGSSHRKSQLKLPSVLPKKKQKRLLKKL